MGVRPKLHNGFRDGHRSRIGNRCLTMCLGGTIDIMAKTAKLAPSWLRKLGLEWLYRLIRQPRRFLRMLDIPRFVWAVFLERIKK